MTSGPLSTNQNPFVDLPASLVEDILSQTSDVAQELLTSFQKVREDHEDLRNALIDSGLILTESSLGNPPLPTTCAADGSYAIERLLTTDLVAAAAVAVEGLQPPSEKRHWELPRHRCFIASEPHHSDTSTVLRSVMLGEELNLITDAPHDLLMLDGTFTLPIIYFNQALNLAPEVNMNCARVFLKNCLPYLNSYLTMLRSERSDKNYVALPKYSTRREIGTKMGWKENYDDRGMLTMLLNPGELTEPITLDHPRDKEENITWHLNTQRLPETIRDEASEVAEKIISELSSLRVFYYKPREWLPTLRIETSSSVAYNKHRLATTLQGIKHQTTTPSMLEPYPIYLADRIVKSLARALPAFKQVTTQRVSEKYNGDIEEVYFAMHGYRSETGR